MASIGVDFYSQNPPQDDVTLELEVAVGALAGAAAGALLGGLLSLFFWKAIIPLGSEMVGDWMAVGTAVFLAVLCGISGGIAAYARSRAG